MSFAPQVARCAEHLADLVLPGGRFIYRYRHDPAHRLPGYNVLRHCGALWSLQQAVAADMAPARLQGKVSSGIDWLVRHRTGQTPTGASFVFERGAIKLGGCGLALLVLAGDAARGDTRELMRRLVRYVCEQESPTGDLVHKRQLESLEPMSFRSEYYTGEALFGLIEAGVVLDDDKAIRFAGRVLHTLAARDEGVAQQSHWMMYAAEALQRVHPDPATIAYMERIASHILHHTAYRQRGTTTPIACRTEALLSLCHARNTAGKTGDALWREAVAAIHENLDIQLRSLTASGGCRRSPEVDEVRIDFIQHNLSGLVGYERLLGNKNASHGRGV